MDEETPAARGRVAGTAPYLFEKEDFQALYDFSCLNIYILSSYIPFISFSSFYLVSDILSFCVCLFVSISAENINLIFVALHNHMI